MDTANKTAPTPAPAPESIDHEDRIDVSAVMAFKVMGYKNRLSPNMISIYRAFKSRKDRIQPGRLSPEGLAFVATLAEMADGNLELDKG